MSPLLERPLGMLVNEWVPKVQVRPLTAMGRVSLREPVAASYVEPANGLLRKLDFDS